MKGFQFFVSLEKYIISAARLFFSRISELQGYC